MFAEPLFVGKPNLGDRRKLLKLLGDAMDRRRLTNDGPLVQEFEARIAKVCKVDHAMAVANATVGLEIAARAAGMKGRVLVPSFTFIASAHAIAWMGMRPVFADVRREDHNLDVADAARRAAGTGGLLGVHLWGNPCDTEGLEELASRVQVPLVFDAAHGFGSRSGGVPLGGHGDAEVFSFHATKFLNALEGGAVTTNDGALAKRVRLQRNFGISGYDQVDMLGTNAKMNEFSAAVGLVNLDAMQTFIDTNRANFKAYLKELDDVPGVRVLTPRRGVSTNHQYVVVEIDHPRTTRDGVQKTLWENNVMARRYYSPGCHRSEPYSRSKRRLPVTEWLADHVLALPTGTAVGPREIAKVCGLIRGSLEGA